jgi:hypothetical protein
MVAGGRPAERGAGIQQITMTQNGTRQMKGESSSYVMQDGNGRVIALIVLLTVGFSVIVRACIDVLFRVRCS